MKSSNGKTQGAFGSRKPKRKVNAKKEFEGVMALPNSIAPPTSPKTSHKDKRHGKGAGNSKTPSPYCLPGLLASDGTQGAQDCVKIKRHYI